MKLDIKSIIILILLGLTLIFGYKWYFDGDGGIDEKLNQLQEKYEIIELEKAESDRRLVDNGLVIDSLLLVDILYVKKIKSLEFNVKTAEYNANRSYDELGEIKRELSETKKKIDELKNDLPNRVGDDLLNSIKNKTK